MHVQVATIQGGIGDLTKKFQGFFSVKYPPMLRVLDVMAVVDETTDTVQLWGGPQSLRELASALCEDAPSQTLHLQEAVGDLAAGQTPLSMLSLHRHGDGPVCVGREEGALLAEGSEEGFANLAGLIERYLEDTPMLFAPGQPPSYFGMALSADQTPHLLTAFSMGVQLTRVEEG